MKEIIEHINDKLKDLASKRFGLCEIIVEEDKSYPGELTKNELKNVSDFDFNNGVIYHRLRGDVSVNDNEDQNVSADSIFKEKTYPLRLIYVKRGRKDGYGDQDLGDLISDKIAASNIRTLRRELKLDSITIEPQGIKTSRDELFREEYTNIEGQIDYEFYYVGIDYNIIITGDPKCL